MGSVDSSDGKSLFASVEVLPFDAAFTVSKAAADDVHPDKVDLGAGVYRGEDGGPYVLPSVREAISRLPDDHEYLPQSGHPGFLAGARELLFGKELLQGVENRLASVQTISGSGSFSVGTRFLTENLRPSTVWLCDPSWTNHALVWQCSAPGVTQRFYPYYDEASRGLNFKGIIDTLEAGAARGDVIILQACAHNPTGVDPTREQWTKIADLCIRKGLFPFFDSAYQGFASGNLEDDAWAVRHFASRGIEMCVGQSFSKNFGLYGERVGALHLLVSGLPSVEQQQAITHAVQTQFVRIMRSTVSSGPAFGSRTVAIVLADPELRKQWSKDLMQMMDRIRSVRRLLYDELVRLETPGSWEHIINQTGMFSYTGLSSAQADKMASDHHVHMLSTGRISVAGLNNSNVKRVAKAMDTVVRAG